MFNRRAFFYDIAIVNGCSKVYRTLNEKAQSSKSCNNSKDWKEKSERKTEKKFHKALLDDMGNQIQHSSDWHTIVLNATMGVVRCTSQVNFPCHGSSCKFFKTATLVNTALHYHSDAKILFQI